MEKMLKSLSLSTINVDDKMSTFPDLEVENVWVFTQMWGNTSLGFGGVGGDAMTSAWTHVVLTNDGIYHIFFNGRYAYSVENPTERFKSDLENRTMLSIDDAKQLY